VWRKPIGAKHVPNSPVPVPIPTQAKPPDVSLPAMPQRAIAQPAASVFPAPLKQIGREPHNPEVSSISSGLRIRGEISGDADLYIDGEAEGRISLAEARLTVGPHGRVRAGIEARDIVIDGVVEGNLNARESVHLGPSSRVQGSVLTKRIRIDDGARVRGKVEMTRPTDAGSSSAVELAADRAAVSSVSARGEDEESDL
jgi:cytoskeletal protein CcmA (bactofilin family)